MAASTRTKQKQEPEPIMEALKVLAKIFDEIDAVMDKFKADGKKWEKQLEAYDLTDPKLMAQVPKTFSPEQVSLLLNIFMQLAQYAGKFSLSEDRVKEAEEMLQMIKDIRSNLHKLLGDKN